MVTVFLIWVIVSLVHVQRNYRAKRDTWVKSRTHVFQNYWLLDRRNQNMSIVPVFVCVNYFFFKKKKKYSHANKYTFIFTTIHEYDIKTGQSCIRDSNLVGLLT